MVMKRKAVINTSDKLFKSGSKAHLEGVAEEEDQSEKMDVVKEDEEQEEVEQEEEEISEEERLAKQEEATVAARRKELKATHMDELKKLVSSIGLALDKKKETMIESVISLEAKQRARKQEHEAKIRDVVVSKKNELEALPAVELKRMTDNVGMKGTLSKNDRVEQLLSHWMKEDGVNLALEQKAFDARREELASMSKDSLKALCEEAEIDPYLKEVMTDRIIKHETETGCFAAPKDEDEPVESTTVPQQSKGKKIDMVDELLANETARKKDVELKKQREKEAASKCKELMSMSVVDLKKELVSNGLGEMGKKEEMVNALLVVREQKEKILARKADLKALGQNQLKSILSSKGLPPCRAIGQMIDAILAHEEKGRTEVLNYAAKVDEAAAKMKADLDVKTGAELKEMCASKGLKLGLTKEERIERLVEEAKRDGELEKICAGMLRTARKSALIGTNKEELQQLCESAGVDALVKEVMTERILEHESSSGLFAPASVAEEPTAKKPRRK